MREILFRGKEIDSDNWIEGYFVNLSGNTAHILRADNNDLEAVVPETVGEFMGKTDKKGKKIFEGDIVQTLETYNGKLRSGFPVVYSLGAFWLYDEWLDTKLDFLGSYENQALEVIGNIYDNPELLKGA